MATDTLDVLGIHFTNVKGFRAKATSDVSDKSYLRPQGSETYTDNNTYDVTDEKIDPGKEEEESLQEALDIIFGK